MALPRSKALSTRLLILLEVHNHRHTRLRTLAERLEVTVQAVSEYLKRLTNEGLVENAAGVWKPTKRGTALLHETMRDLRGFLDGAMEHLAIIQETYALAAHQIRAEEDVGLFMRDGHLWAGTPARAASRGTARTPAKQGQLVLVGNLRGMLRLEPAPVTLLVHPEFPDEAALSRARRVLDRHRGTAGRRLLAVHDDVSHAWALALGIEPDLEFAPTEATRDASQRGVAVLYLVAERDRPACEHALRQAAAQRGHRVSVRSVTL